MAPPRRLVRLVPYAAVAFAILVAVGIVFVIKEFLASGPVDAKKTVQQISLVKPPPPPPPPKVEKPPEPEMEKIEEPEPEPEDIPDAPSDEPPPGAELGLDAEGGAGSDAFGLLGKKGGRSLLGGGGDPNAWYAGVLQREMQDLLAVRDEVRRGRYAVTVKLWIDPDGRVGRYELLGTTGTPEVDEALRDALAAARIREPPPEGMPQPVRLRIVSRL